MERNSSRRAYDRTCFSSKRVLHVDRSTYKEAIEKVRKDNYERIFDDARERVRGWEQTHAITRNTELERTTP
jgi:hypothetical protein